PRLGLGAGVVVGHPRGRRHDILPVALAPWSQLGLAHVVGLGDGGLVDVGLLWPLGAAASAAGAGAWASAAVDEHVGALDDHPPPRVTRTKPPGAFMGMSGASMPMDAPALRWMVPPAPTAWLPQAIWWLPAVRP